MQVSFEKVSLKQLLDNSLAIIIVLFFMFVGYRYMGLQFDHMRAEFDEKLKDKRYIIEGEVSPGSDDDPNTYNLKLVLFEQTMSIPEASN